MCTVSQICGLSPLRWKLGSQFRQSSLQYSVRNDLRVFHRSFVAQHPVQLHGTFSQHMGEPGEDSGFSSDSSRKCRSFDFIDPGPIPPWSIRIKYSSTFPTAKKILQSYHGHSDFRGEQEKVISRLQHKGSTLYMMPTGAGKSLIYQILARTIEDEGIILVLAPLLSLIRDQVKAANALGLAAEGIHGNMTTKEVMERNAELYEGKIRIIFVCPERLQDAVFMGCLSNNKLLMFVIDECHIIPLYGPQYRPSLLRLPSIHRELDPERTLLLTATATEEWLQDLSHAFHIPETGIFRTSVYRPNLSLQVKKVDCDKEQYKQLVEALRRKTAPGVVIVYVNRRKEAERITFQLKKEEDLPFDKFDPYHARLHSKIRNRVQDEFTTVSEQKMVVVATKAFGMGLNKSCVRQVIHYNASLHPSEYLQEVGRAGRDNQNSQCLTLLNPLDIYYNETKTRSLQTTVENVTDWLQDLPVTVGRVLRIETWKQALKYDMELLTLEQLYAILEYNMDYQFLKRISSTTRPLIYKFRARKVAKGKYERDQKILLHAFRAKLYEKQHLQNEYHKEDIKTAECIFENSRPLRSGWCLDLRNAADRHNLVLQDLLNLLYDWQEEFKIVILSLGVRDSFKIIKGFPADYEGLQDLAQQLHAELKHRVEDQITNSRTMASILEAKSCMAARLVKLHVGENIPGSGVCGNCTFCATKNIHQDLRPDPQESQTKHTRRDHISSVVRRSVLWQRRYLRDLERFQQVYEAVGKAKIFKAQRLQCSAETLTKVAFGVRSPDITSSGLASSKIFGSMANWPYNELHEGFKTLLAAKHAMEETDIADSDGDGGQDRDEVEL